MRIEAGAVRTSESDECGVRSGLMGEEGERALWNGLMKALPFDPMSVWEEGEEGAEEGGEGG